MKHITHRSIALLVILFTLGSCTPKSAYIKNQGSIYGTFYHFTYEHPQSKDIHTELQDVMHDFERSLSTFKKESTISKINNNTDLSTDKLFEQLYYKANEISTFTEGAFDITVAPLVNLWGFGYQSFADSLVNKNSIDSILEFTGYKLVQLNEGSVLKADPRVKLDASAIAKGFSVDLVAEYLEHQNIQNYLVEIGGEIRVKGQNPNGTDWIIGIDKPIDDPAALNRAIQQKIKLRNNALATSGNYRNFYIKDGIKYSHTIDPKSGYPVEHNLLSATVIAKDCMTADAWATACMVMGVKKSMEKAIMNKNIELYLLYDDNKTVKAVYSDGFKPYLMTE